MLFAIRKWVSLFKYTVIIFDIRLMDVLSARRLQYNYNYDIFVVVSYATVFPTTDRKRLVRDRHPMFYHVTPSVVGQSSTM